MFEKKVYIVRTVGLFEVAFTDEVFTTRKEAEECYRELQKNDIYSDFIVKVTFHDEEQYEDFINGFIDSYEVLNEALQVSYEIIKKR